MSTSWRAVHEELSRLARSKGAYDAEEARWLLEGRRVRVHERLGYGTYFGYLEHLFGYGPRLARERLRVAEALAGLPELANGLASGAMSWSAAREISRVAVPATEAEWIAAARGKTVREIEELVSGRRAGSRPGDPADPGARRHVLRLEISADALAAFRDARRHIELEVGHSLDDDEAVRMLAHHALGGPGDPGRAAYQVAMTVCQECGRGTRDGAGQVLAVEPHQVEAALCDAQEIDLTHAGHEAAATQSIPPRVRRLVWRRDHGRCQVPGCRSAKYLELHHITPRGVGGTHDPSNLVLACGVHHAQVHAGTLRIEGTAPDRLVVRRLDERPPSQRNVDLDSAAADLLLAGDHSDSHEARPGAGLDRGLEADAVGALVRMGVQAGHARQAVAQAAASSGADIEDLLRHALRVLARTAYASRLSTLRGAALRSPTGSTSVGIDAPAQS